MRSFQRLLGGRRGVALFMIWMAFALSMIGQERGRPGKPIDIDKELAEKVPQNRAKSYFHFSLSKWHEAKGEFARALSEMRLALKYDDASVTVRVELAALLEHLGQLRDAVAEAQEAAALEPQNPEPHWLLANLYVRMQGRERGQSREYLNKAVEELESMRRDSPRDERSYLALGRIYLQLDEEAKAIEAFEKFQSLVPGSEGGAIELANYFERKSDPAKALNYLRKALENQPDSPQVIKELAELLERMDNHKEAVPFYRKLLELTGGNAGVKRQLAAALVETGEYQQANVLLEELLKITPSNREVKVLYGRSLVGVRENARAIELLKGVVKADPYDLGAYFYLGVAYEQTGQAAEAVKIFSKLVEQTKAGGEQGKGNRAVFQQHLAAAYQDLGDHEKAIVIFESLLKNDGDSNPRIGFQLINAYRLAKKYDRALALGKAEFEKHPEDAVIGMVYARSLADSGKAREGADILQRLLQADPANEDIYVNLSQIYLQGKRYAEAEKTLRRAADRKLESERIKFQLATVYERQKEFDRAESIFRQLLQENPKNPVVLNYIGYMLADRGVRLDEALKYVQQALEIDPENGAYLDSLGWAQFKLNNLDQAEKNLLRAAEIVKNDPVIHDHLGELYFRTGELAKAEEYWKRSISIGGEQEDNDKVRGKLEKVQEMLKRQRKR